MKTKVFITAMALVATIGLATAQNQNQAAKETAKTAQTGPAFVDKNNNGVCDNFENGTPGNPNANGKQRLLDGSGRGQGKGQGLRNGRGQGRFFVDADKDGVCDNFENGTPRGGRGQGYGNGLRNGRGGGANFVDADKDGICDNFENGTPRQGRGTGKGTGLRNGKGSAVNFVDANKNGICDRRETTK